MSRKTFVTLLVIYALVGASLTFAYYLVPGWQNSKIASFFVPLKGFVDPVFGEPMNINLETAKMMAIPNGIVYVAFGVLLTGAGKLTRDALLILRYRDRQD